MPSRSSSSTGLTAWLLIAAVIILADQFTKILIIGSFNLGDVHRVTSFFDLVRAHNFGAAFSFLHGASGWQRWFFLGLGLAAAVFIVWMLRRHGHQRLFSWALTLILGGDEMDVVLGDAGEQQLVHRPPRAAQVGQQPVDALSHGVILQQEGRALVLRRFAGAYKPGTGGKLH